MDVEWQNNTLTRNRYKKCLLLLSGIGLGAGLAYTLYQDRQVYHRAMDWMTHDSQRQQPAVFIGSAALRYWAS